MKRSAILYLISLLALFDISCAPLSRRGPSAATAPVVVYKTRGDYRDLVTVQLSSDGQSVAAFPAPSDAIRQRPIPLANGYLLKRMVGDTYLSLSIEAYAKASRRYTSDELMEMVVDTDPYLERYDCAECTGLDTTSINTLIRAGELKKCRSVR
jgi:hypothetical protein